ncbi:unnamed protein product, partial [Larinioides sclopetarius]
LAFLSDIVTAPGVLAFLSDIVTAPGVLAFLSDIVTAPERHSLKLPPAHIVRNTPLRIVRMSFAVRLNNEHKASSSRGRGFGRAGTISCCLRMFRAMWILTNINSICMFTIIYISKNNCI